MKRTKHPKPKFKGNHLDFIRQIAWSFHTTTGIPFEDLYAEGCLHYWECVFTYDPCKRAKFSTFIYKIVRLRLIDYCRNEAGHKATVAKYKQPISYTPKYEYWEWFKPDTQTIVDIVRNSNGEISGVPPKMARGVIRRELRELGWTWPRIWDAIRDTKQVVQETEVGTLIV